MPGFGVPQVGLDPTAASNLNDQMPRCDPGTEVYYGGSWYMYVKFDDGVGNVASAVNRVAYWKDRALGVVTSDKSDGQVTGSIGAGGAGIFQGVITDLYYTWIQRRGYRAKVRLDATGAIGNKVHANIGTTDLILTTVTDASAATSAIVVERVATQLAAADGSNDAACYLMFVS